MVRRDFVQKYITWTKHGEQDVDDNVELDNPVEVHKPIEVEVEARAAAKPSQTTQMLWMSKLIFMLRNCYATLNCKILINANITKALNNFATIKKPSKDPLSIHLRNVVKSSLFCVWPLSLSN